MVSMAQNVDRATGRAVWLGTDIDYQEAWDLQRRIASDVADGAPDTLLLLEHAPVYTAGRRSSAEHILGELGAPLVETDRGGQVTYHGPGQLVGYPIVDVKSKGLGPKAYVQAIEKALLHALTFYCVLAHTEDGLTGVWTKQGKIAAIGVKIAHGVSMHGFALNVATDLAAYEPIVPCGISDRPTVNMVQTLGSVPDMADVRSTVESRIGETLGVEWVETPATALG
jgi:lipoyl(octanoyl) transferase